MIPDEFRWSEMISDDPRWPHMIPDDFRRSQMIPDDPRWSQMINPDYPTWPTKVLPDDPRWSTQTIPDDLRWSQTDVIPDDPTSSQMIRIDRRQNYLSKSQFQKIPGGLRRSQTKWSPMISDPHGPRSSKCYLGSYAWVIRLNKFLIGTYWDVRIRFGRVAWL